MPNIERTHSVWARTAFRACAVVGSLATSIGFGVVAAPPAHAAARLGGININWVCAASYPSSIAWGDAYAANVRPNNAYSWRCFWGPNSYGIDLNAGCSMQYGRGAWAATNNPSSPYSWSCYR